jgi:hypothetical protein
LRRFRNTPIIAPAGAMQRETRHRRLNHRSPARAIMRHLGQPGHRCLSRFSPVSPVSRFSPFLPMIGHQAVVQHLQSLLITAFPERVEIHLAMDIIEEDALPSIPALRDVVCESRNYNPSHSSHNTELVPQQPTSSRQFGDCVDRPWNSWNSTRQRVATRLPVPVSSLCCDTRVRLQIRHSTGS